MVTERRKTFLGRSKGLDVLRECALIGDPLQRMELLLLEVNPFDLGGAIMPDSGLLADCGLRSLGEESEKHSSREIDVEFDNLLLTGPKRKGGTSGLLREGIELVE